MLNSQAQGGDKSRQTHQSLQRVLRRMTFIQGLNRGIVQWVGCEGKRTSWIARVTTAELIYTWTRTT